jgi:CRISPR-associated protein Csb2
MPAFRRRQPRRFPAARPLQPIVRLVWDGASAGDSILPRLQALATDTSYVGHSASLTRCHFQVGNDVYSSETLATPRLGIYPGRLSELREAFRMGHRPASGMRISRTTPNNETKVRSCFGSRWIIFECINDDYQEDSKKAAAVPDIRATALVAKAFRDALLAGYDRIGLGNQIPEEISGHSPDRNPSRSAHLAIVPMAFAGYPHADGHLMGFALVPPRESGILEDETFLRVLRHLAPLDSNRNRRVLQLKPKAGTKAEGAFSVRLSPIAEIPPNKRSLGPDRYLTPSHIYATVTPMVLDRHLKQGNSVREEEIVQQIVSACRNIGLPEPLKVAPGKHSAVEGAPSARPSGRSPAWLGWRLPSSLASRPLTHAVLEFPEQVEGPVLLGAGRFVGLGMCLPIQVGEGKS